ncbi:unnamed protein product [Phaedon cochleariae]|uniref:Uncharacterized protein n=1 Tax=Phaedon cochleariae TaxID=80249 RepID=A0A9P0DEG1_PHACE|nr:unnamed protein product [Phaedon cochleariae]
MTNGTASDKAESARILKYDFDNIGTGSYRFGFESSDGIKRQETGEVHNEGSTHQFVKVAGSYSYLGPDGHLYEVRYTADDQGFHPEGDHIKVPPFVPWIHHHNDEHQFDHDHHHKESSSLKSFTTIVDTSSSEKISSDVTRNIPPLSTAYLPDSSTAKPKEVIPSKTSQPYSDRSLITDSQPQPNYLFFSNPEAQTPIGYFTPRPDGPSIDENSESRYYIPPVTPE